MCPEIHNKHGSYEEAVLDQDVYSRFLWPVMSPARKAKHLLPLTDC
jgi:hypothetical protein